MEDAILKHKNSFGSSRSLAGNYISDGHHVRKDFHTLYRDRAEAKKIKEKPNAKKKSKGAKEKKKSSTSSVSQIQHSQRIIELQTNPSSFAVYDEVRSLLLESLNRKARNIYLVSTAQLEDASSETDLKINKEVLQEVPKIVYLGLMTVYEIIKGSVNCYPELCTNALRSLLDVLQGQEPSALDREPSTVLDSLFLMLKELSTSEPGEDTTKLAELYGIACSALLALVVASGNTCKILQATCEIITNSKSLSEQLIQVPLSLTLLQRSAQAVLLGKTLRPDWLFSGIQRQSLSYTFKTKITTSGKSAIVADGQYLYIHNYNGLSKIGTGYGDTKKGYIYFHDHDFFPDNDGWLGCCKDYLLFRSYEDLSKLVLVDKATFEVKETIDWPGKLERNSIVFTDGNCVGNLTANKAGGGFVVEKLNISARPVTVTNELYMLLEEGRIEAFGGDGQRVYSPNIDGSISTINGGKEFTLVTTAYGKVYFQGRGTVIGMKSGPGRSDIQDNKTPDDSVEWPEVVIAKNPRITCTAVGHEGQHAVFVTEDGVALFAGTAKFSEDGESKIAPGKVRGAAKPVKPKRMVRMDGKFVITAACNNGTTALVTKDGELYLFGKDAFCCNSSTGLLVGLKDANITAVSLGKAHVVALSQDGNVFTFGVNNKGQCGREWLAPCKDTGTSSCVSTTVEDYDLEDEVETGEDKPAVPVDLCEPFKHRWRREQCIICTVCHECTGYGESCVYSSKPLRQPGKICGCGSGDAGCAECGSCRACANYSSSEDEPEPEPDQEPDIPGAIVHAPLQVYSEFPNVVIKGVYNFGGIYQRERRKAHAERADRKKRPLRRKCYVPEMPVKEEVTNNEDKDSSKLVALDPAKVKMPAQTKVIKIACGLHHTVCLCANGEVYTWGNNAYGQLGTGDLESRGSPVLMRLPPTLKICEIAAGSSHTVLLTATGQVYTCGAYQKGQLGRCAPHCEAGEGSSRTKIIWYTVPGAIPGFGPRQGRKANWIGCSGDTTFIKLFQCLINPQNLFSFNIIANSSCLLLIPISSRKPSKSQPESQWKSLAINRLDGACRSHSNQSQMDFSGLSVCLDTLYNVIWSFDNKSRELNCFNILISAANRPPLYGVDDGLRDILSPELAIPIDSNVQISRSQAALHMLACIDVMAWANQIGMSVVEDNLQNTTVAKTFAKEDFSCVNRFDGHGGGWGYSGHSIEAVRFMVDTDILIGGFGLFGGRGEYMGRIRLFELGVDGGEYENDGIILAESEDVMFECPPRQKFSILFDEPVPILAHRWYVAWARLSGPSSDCGSCGQPMISTDDQVLFIFKSSKRSNNGTDANGGQIPQILYKISNFTAESQQKSLQSNEVVPILPKSFFFHIGPGVYTGLKDLLLWAWESLCVGISQLLNEKGGNSSSGLDFNRLVYICCASLRLLRFYVTGTYPLPAKIDNDLDTLVLAEEVYAVKNVIKTMLSEMIPSLPYFNCEKEDVSKDNKLCCKLVTTVLGECHRTFVSCFHAFYPTGQLKWNGLCDLLLSRDEGSEASRCSDRLLSAFLASLCSPTVKLRATCPILADTETELTQRPSPADNAALSTQQPGDLCRYPTLVEHMTYKTEDANFTRMMWTFREVLDRLLGILCGGVRQALREEKVLPLPALVNNTCLFLTTVVSELTCEALNLEAVVPPASKMLHTTPNRFLRMSQSRTWSTGNGSTDAICFTVDRPAIHIDGFGIYGGVGNYEFEIELHDQSNQAESSRSVDRWNVVDSTRGTFGPDDLISDIYEAKFTRPVLLKEGVKYALRLSNRGERTSNGDGGVSHIKGPDGTTFTFSACSLSINGTNHIRGQIPYIMYYSTQEPDNQQNTKGIAERQAKKAALTMVGTIIRSGTEIMIMGLGVGNETAIRVLGSTPMLVTLLPLILAHIKRVAVQDPRSAVTVLSFMQEILPQVAALNNLSQAIKKSLNSDSADDSYATTSPYYITVESEHPYKPATITNYRVTFPSTVKWMVIDFDPESYLAQVEDVLKLYVPSSDALYFDKGSKIIENKINMSDWILLDKFSALYDWPKHSSVLPGNEIMFSLETATDYIKDEKSHYYGYKALVTGYDWPLTHFDALRHLEKEVALLGGVCSVSLISRDLILPPIPGEEPEDDMESVEEVSALISQSHPSLLRKGFALSHPPTIYQTLDGVIPFSCHSHERLFLRDFVAFSENTSGGRLAHWLQPDSHIDPKNCNVIYSKDELRAGWPTAVTVVTRDQYGDVVHSTNMKMEIAAVPSLVGETGLKHKIKKFGVNLTDSTSFGGKHPSIDMPYQVSIKDKVFYNAITMMKCYENYSFEELRLASPSIRRPTENMLVRRNGDGTYTCNWTPGAAGWYTFKMNIDGYPFEKVIKVHVKDSPSGAAPPQVNAVKKPPLTQCRLRKFAIQDSAGLRIRVYPTLQSEQIGVISFNGTIVFVDEVHNNDGVWLRLSEETTRQYCEVFYKEAWCLQFNQHSGRTLLAISDHPKGSPQTNGEAGSRHYRLAPGEPTCFTVVKSGASGHNIRSKASLKGAPVGMLVLGNLISVDGKLKNSEGTWMRLDSDSCHKYCFTVGEAWSLAVSRCNTLYLQAANEPTKQLPDSKSAEASEKGFDYSHTPFKPFPATQKPSFVFGAVGTNVQDGCFENIPMNMSCDVEEESKIGEPQKMDEAAPGGQKFSLLHKWLKDETEKKKPVTLFQPPIKEIKSDFPGVSVKELVKAIGESRANGNGATPPRTPPATPKRTSRSCSPRNPALSKPTPALPVPTSGSMKPTGAVFGLSPSKATSSIDEANHASCNSLSDSSVIGSSLPRDFTLSTAASSQKSSESGTPKKSQNIDPPALVKSMTQSATQTSPDGLPVNNTSLPSYDDGMKLSPKGSRRDRTAKHLRGKREKHPSVSVDKQNNTEIIKEAMSPSEAECLRAVFASFLWHEGVVHDAMACASYLKFHPDLKKLDSSCKFNMPSPRASEPVRAKLTKEQKARQRHSVEVSAYSYLNVTVQNPEEFLKLGSNVNIVESLSQEISEDGSKPSTATTFQEANSANSKLTTVLEGADAGQHRPELPLGLQHVLLLWEELSSSCSKAISRQIILGSPTKDSRRMRKADKNKEIDKEKDKDKDKRRRKKSGGKDVTEDEMEDGRYSCNICGHTLTAQTCEVHFNSSHPGCFNPSHGCGYASGKWKFFASEERWGIPCGEMFKGCFHMCWLCRTKHLAIASQKDGNKKNKRKTGVKMVSPSPFSLDTHLIMRNNAMFLLDLESSASSNILTRSNPPKRSYNSMPCVSELSPENCPFPKVAFQCLHTLNCQQQHLNQLREDLLLQQHAMNSSDPGTNRSHSSSGDSKELQKDHSFSPVQSHHGSPSLESEGSSARSFHDGRMVSRSLSVTINHTGQDWGAIAGQNDSPTRQGVVYRKRNNSSCEPPGAGVSSLLAHPSVALEKLVNQIGPSVGIGEYGGRGWAVVVRPIMNFIFQNHDLETLAFAMRHATRKAAARVYGLQALNWLIRSVTQPTCLHDLLWCLAASLAPSSKNIEDIESNLDQDHDKMTLEHPLSDVTLAGDAVHPLSGTFYQILQTVADLMMLLPAGSPLQMMAVRCWGIKFLPPDHDFLHQSHVFSNISKILSKSDEILGDDIVSSFHDIDEPYNCRLAQMVDVTGQCKVRTSSRAAMISSLTDGSTETFWESGDDDRNKSKTISVQMSSDFQYAVMYMHIDNCRDMGSKISSVTFKSGYTLDDAIGIQQIDLDTRFAGWINCPVSNFSENPLTVTADLRGPDQNVRVRQMRMVVTAVVGPTSNDVKIKTKIFSASTLQQKACEHETLRVFKLITAQVFGRLLNEHNSENAEGVDIEASTPLEGAKSDYNNDLREHMVGILFSRPSLSHLQKQVCSHIVQALKKEAKRLREDWDACVKDGKQPLIPSSGDQGPNPDSYCFEMLSMVLALSGSAVGRAYLAPQESLIKHILSLLHTGSARVQRQVVSLFRRILVDISPSTMANVMSVNKLPTLDMKLMQASVQEADNCNHEYKIGILDVFLSVIAKTLNVQIKNRNHEHSLNAGRSAAVKCNSSAVRVSGKTFKRKMNTIWWLQGDPVPNLSKLIIALIRDMTNGKLTEEWAEVSKGAIAENILNLTRIAEHERTNEERLIITPTLWFALASLCVLHPDHVDTLSSQQWKKTDGEAGHSKPHCENHDDGETLAIILCTECGNLCGDCDRILHLNRRARGHQRNVFREEQQAIKVDLHEGCGRAKLFWLLALTDSFTFKSLIEVREESKRGTNTGSNACRFCGNSSHSCLLSTVPVCHDEECQGHSRIACTKTLTCGHLCSGLEGETVCFPCLQGCTKSSTLKQDGDDMCMICFSEALSAAPCIQLECGHVFHAHCCRSVLLKKWPGPRITFTFSQCPICKVTIKHWWLKRVMQIVGSLYDDVRRKALMRLEYEGLLRSEAITTKGARYYNEPASFAMDKYAYYVCFKCKKAYYGGEVRCEVEVSDEYDPRELVCGACSDVTRAQMCPKHGQDFLEYKCRYCCSVAVFFCFGTTHFCNSCHEEFQKVTGIPKNDLPACPAGPKALKLEGEECPLHVQHPPTGEEFALGCGVCRNAHTF